MSGLTAFVLDMSYSMRGPKWEALRLETTRFMESVPDNNWAGIVKFNSIASTLHELTRISSRQVRDELIAKIPKQLSKHTDIRAGIMEGLALLTRANVSTHGAKIYLVTDGGHNRGNSDYVGDVLPHLKKAQVSVICVTIGRKADKNLERLTNETQGSVFNMSQTDGMSSVKIGQIMNAAMKELVTSDEMAEVITHTLVDQVVTIDGKGTYQMDVPFESDIGSNTKIQVRTEDIQVIDLTVRSSTGAELSTTAGQVTKRIDLKQCQLHMNTTEPGIWSIKVRNQNSSTISAHLIVESEANGVQAINMDIYLKAPDTDCPPLIVCKLFKDKSIIIGAMVTATVDRPDGTQIDLLLNRYHKDGYYYNYFTNYSGTGRYNVNILAGNSGNNTTCQGKVIKQFRRQRVVSCFKVNNSMPNQPPTNPDHFQQLLLNQQFGNISINKPRSINIKSGCPPSTSNATINSPGTSLSDLITPQMRARKQALAVNHYKTKKAINSSNLSDQDKQNLVKTLNDFDNYFNLVNQTSDEEINSYQARLDAVNDRINKL